MLTWLKTNWKFASTILTIIVAAFGVKFTVQPAPPGTEPQVIVVVPGLDPEPATFLGKAPEGFEIPKDRHVLVNVARRFAGQKYARENGLTREQGRILAYSVTPKMIEDRVADEKLLGSETWEGIPPSGGRLSDWLAAHPDFFNNLIKLIMMLIPLFAADHQPGILDKPFDDVRICQVPYPLAWTRPVLSLAC